MLTYIPWYFVARLLDYYAPGWQGQVVSILVQDKKLEKIVKKGFHGFNQ